MIVGGNCRVRCTLRNPIIQFAAGHVLIYDAKDERAMRVKLIVVNGSNAGKEVKIPVPKCVIGRGDDCHLRPRSDAISRRHCAFLVKDSKVVLRDLKSKNGTFVNGERIEGDAVLSGGERIRIGPLEFEVIIDLSLGGEKKPKVKDVKDAASRAAEGRARDEDITGWLEEADEMERERRMADPDTRSFKMDDTNRLATETITLDNEDLDESDAAVEDAEDEETEDGSSGLFGMGKKKKKFGKLPHRPSVEAESSTKAAEDMLKKFFNRR
jgi:pSer/pThr/pTyr-binding forkhead associated (FHA) protein